MRRLTVAYPVPEDEAAFKSYYEASRAPLAMKLPGLKRAHFAYPDPVGLEKAVFCIFQAFFEDAEAMGAAMASEAGREIAADVPNYSPKGAQIFHFVVES